MNIVRRRDIKRDERSWVHNTTKDKHGNALGCVCDQCCNIIIKLWSTKYIECMVGAAY